MTALRISLKTTRNIDNVGRKFQKIVVYRLVIPWIKFWIWLMASRLWREGLEASWRKWKKNLHIRNSEFLLAFYTNLIQLNRTFLKLPVLQFQTRHTSDSLGKEKKAWSWSNIVVYLSTCLDSLTLQLNPLSIWNKFSVVLDGLASAYFYRTRHLLRALPRKVNVDAKNTHIYWISYFKLKFSRKKQ